MRARAISGEREPIILIPCDRKRGTIERRVERAVRWLWSRGIYPSPTAVSLRLHGHPARNINGKESSARIVVMDELNIEPQRRNVGYRAKYRANARPASDKHGNRVSDDAAKGGDE